MRYLSLPYRNIVRRPARSAMTVGGVAVAVGAVVALVGIARGFEKSLLAVYRSRGADLMVIRAGSMQRFSSILEERLGERIRGLAGVRSVSPTLVDVVAYEELNLFGVVIQAMPVNCPPLSTVKLVAGRRIRPGDGRAVMLGRVLARNLEKSVNDTFEVIEGEPYRVVGIYESYNVFENGSMIMTIGQLQRMMGREGDVTGFSVTAVRKDKRSLEALARRIEHLAPGLEALPTRQYIDTSVEIRMGRAVAWLTSTIALVIGTIGMVNTMLTAVFERTQEIALLRAVGWRKWSVMRLVLLEAVLLGLAGAVVGSLSAIGLTLLLSRLPASGRMVSGQIAPSVVLQGFAIAVAVGVAGGLYPAYRATRLQPTEGLRHE